ncbi:hypothetical protein ACTXT7_009678 [Hymenolepis weldensis]
MNQEEGWRSEGTQPSRSNGYMGLWWATVNAPVYHRFTLHFCKTVLWQVLPYCLVRLLAYLTSNFSVATYMTTYTPLCAVLFSPYRVAFESIEFGRYSSFSKTKVSIHFNISVHGKLNIDRTSFLPLMRKIHTKWQDMERLIAIHRFMRCPL